jgi:signal transduction histidine kinase
MDPLRLPPLKRLGAGHWAALDWLCTAALALTYPLAFGQLANAHGTPRWAAAILVALAVLPAGLRRRWPLGSLALVTSGGALLTALSTSPAPALAIAFVMYLIPLRLPLRAALLALAGSLVVTSAGLTAFALIPHGAYGAGGVAKAAALLGEDGLLIAGAWIIGYTVRQQRAYAAGLREQAERKAHEQLEAAKRASAEERLRIAREVHDVVAHTMSLIAVQAGVANYVAESQPAEAARALASIEEISRGALAEMRALLGVLRAADDESLDPTPGLADLGTLAERAAEAGVLVDIDVRGESDGQGQLRVVPPGLDLAAYRVVQEAVTNVIKHAATDRCAVSVAYRDDQLTIEVTDGGRGPRQVPDGSPAPGHGIAGMRERVTMYGGELLAGPLPDRGFRVTARFPLAAGRDGAASWPARPPLADAAS